MKKRLFGILTILGILLSFCSAEEYTFTLIGPEVEGYYKGIYYSNVVFDGPNKDNLYSSLGNNIGSYPQFSISGFISDVYLKEICFGDPRNYGGSLISLDINGYIGTIVSNSNKIVCYSFSGFNLSQNGFTAGPFYNTPNWNQNQHSFGCSTTNSFTIPNGAGSFSFSFTNLISSLPDFILTISGVKYGVCVGVPYSITLIIPSPPSPKFKINYGNTFYEYELTDNLEIHLKSPVNMSGSYNYIYDGSTGINLFYNNTSDFYNKDKLYLKSMYWYNKNIFTPICL